jgi:hypothetical protein
MRTAAQPYVDGYRVRFDMYLGVTSLGILKVDLVTGPPPTGTIDTLDPATRLITDRLTTYPYRVFPICNQIADKVCAIMTTYSDGRSASRAKDLVDLVVIANTQQVNAMALNVAIAWESRRRQLGKLERLAIPPSWVKTYVSEAKSVPACGGHPDVASAAQFMEVFIDPVLAGRKTGTWEPTALAWL